MPIPDYLICLNCETPCYVFEWENDRPVEVLCQICGNDDPREFITPQEAEEADEFMGHD